ncbi:Nif3-like dinuclear metal center hexameric protein [Verrucomicrobiaceae bacterium 5K15]|uniref:GTP cyclohydrolase 1 type 2 homolog n=1 Tax=Oceaniferula flava TaxID=2800421 RepID=A0AAE2SD23_9BACT|nr:Nif3-like dinuclear metal center hexameric protein [Oceaniferula flavus]MBK1854061.1 Nif3-like dinuclear metal center hexameric protein [Oceaniferula flavus]MBM1135367.1 Nif3-like dinuclear metal center hexameric protein [Oceaniferula flavus]
MAQLSDITTFLDQELNIAEIPDYSGAVNGLQIDSHSEVLRVGAAVDASLPVFEKAVAQGVDLLIVHHGMFWQGAQTITGAMYRKLKLAVDSGMALYSAHIPLDVHAQYGNNRLLANALEMGDAVPFFDWKGIQLGLKQQMDVDLDTLHQRLTDAVAGPVHVCVGGANSVGRVGVITGGAGSEVAAMAAEGIDTFITGEGPHWSFPLAEELGVNLLYAGHYATETFGVKALATLLSERFKLQSTFIDHPTGL